MTKLWRKIQNIITFKPSIFKGYFNYFDFYNGF